MTLDCNLLNFIKPDAEIYIGEVINSTISHDYHKLKKIFEDKCFEAKSFDDTSLDILCFSWQNLERDRNWWWQLQALPFLNWYANSWALQSDEERSRYFLFCLDAIECWIKEAKHNTESPLAWHDHAAAFRVRNLTNWLVFCHSAGLMVKEEVRAKALSDLIIEHLDWLQEDKNYSKHTNHGFDQAMIALAIGLLFDFDQFETYRHRNRERLKDEITFAFTDEGVHKENSPGYQKMMLARLKQLRALALLGEQELLLSSESYIGKAEAFLRAITLPDGYLPMIGDTRGGDKGLPYYQNEIIDILDYSSSGYVIIRGTVLQKDFHLVFKASHFSHYHRHDDDLSIHLYFDGKVLLGDGGLGSHNEQDEKRIALRSWLCHNTPCIINKKATRKVSDFPELAPRIVVRDKCIIGKSHCFGYEITRKLDFSELIDGFIYIRDSIKSDQEACLAVNFFSPACLREDDNNIIISVDGRAALRVAPLSSVSIKHRSSPLSKVYSKFSTGNSAIMTPKESGESEITNAIELCSMTQNLHEINYRGFGPRLCGN